MKKASVKTWNSHLRKQISCITFPHVQILIHALRTANYLKIFRSQSTLYSCESHQLRMKMWDSHEEANFMGPSWTMLPFQLGKKCNFHMNM